MVGLIDADFIKYLVSYDIERMFKGGLRQDAVIPLTTIATLTEKRLDVIRESTASEASDYIYLFSGRTRDNYRAQVATVKRYKGNRKYTAKYPNEYEYRSAVEEYIKENYHYHKEDDLEADDLCVMGHNDNTFIYSNDKDLRMSPGVHFDIKLKKFFKTTKEDGFRLLLTQCMSGDSTDNIEGIYGVGKVGAEKITSSFSDLKEASLGVVEQFIDKLGPKEGLDRFVEMYSLVNLKTCSGNWTQEKYKIFFDKLEKIINDDGKSNFI